MKMETAGCTTKENKPDFLDAVKTASKTLTRETFLYFVRGALWENVRYRYGYLSKEIFQAAYDDPSGSAYWQGWLGVTRLTVLEFVRILAIHNAAEYVDVHTQQHDWSHPMEMHPMEIYNITREKVIFLLSEAEKIKALEFEGKINELKTVNIESQISSGRVREDAIILGFSQVYLCPRKALEWLVNDIRSREILPTSLHEQAQSLMSATRNKV
jgi:hypothetical protein